MKLGMYIVHRLRLVETILIADALSIITVVLYKWCIGLWY